VLNQHKPKIIMKDGKGYNIEPFQVISEKMVTSVLSRGTEPEIPTGIPSLDDAIWGLHKKEIMVIEANSSEGKSAFSMQIAWYIASIVKKAVCYISLEMYKEQLSERIFCSLNKIDSYYLRRGIIDDNIRQALEKFKTIEGKMLMVDDFGYRFDEVKRLVLQCVPQFDVVVLDYLQMIDSTEFGGNEYSAITNWMRELKQLVKDNNLSLVLVSQFSLEGMRRDVKAMGWAKGSSAIEQGADTVILLKWLHKHDEDETNLNKYHARILKQRHGPTGTVNLMFYPEYYLFTDAPKEDEMGNRNNDDM